MDDTDKEFQLQEIRNKVAKCTKCPLYKLATNPVPGDGNSNSEIVFIGEAPGFNEDQQGIPFVGRAGKLLEFMLGQIGYKRKDVWIGNIIKHRPPDNRDPLPAEIDSCKGYLTEQLIIINPLLIVTLGRFSMNYFLPNAKITTSRGILHKINNKNIYPVYHPAAGLRNPKMKSILISDFLKIPEILKNLKNTDIIHDGNSSDNRNIHLKTTNDISTESKNPNEKQISLF